MFFLLSGGRACEKKKKNLREGGVFFLRAEGIYPSSKEEENQKILRWEEGGDLYKKTK